jgi:predicted nucleic acid-binding protein
MPAPVEFHFVDTNILVYAHDVSAGKKHQQARDLLQALWEARTGGVSVQVLQEFYVAVTQKVPDPLRSEEAARIVADLGTWRVHSPSAPDVLAAIDLQLRHRISFWDAMILQSAIQLGSTVLLSEDLNPGQIYDGVRVRNPFAAVAGS